jgi:hypothetical protein
MHLKLLVFKLHISQFIIIKLESETLDSKEPIKYISKIIYDKLLYVSPDIILKSTDVQDLSDFIDDSSYPVEFGLNSVQTIEKYKNDGYNILMIILQ